MSIRQLSSIHLKNGVFTATGYYRTSIGSHTRSQAHWSREATGNEAVVCAVSEAFARMAWLHTGVGYARPKTVTHPSTNRAQRRVTSFMRRTALPLRQATSRDRRVNIFVFIHRKR